MTGRKKVFPWNVFGRAYSRTQPFRPAYVNLDYMQSSKLNSLYFWTLHIRITWQKFTQIFMEILLNTQNSITELFFAHIR